MPWRKASQIKPLIFISIVILMLTLVQSAPHTVSSTIAISTYPEWDVCGFFARSYNSSLQLVSEIRGSRTFYVTSDNLLAGPVMEGGLCGQNNSYGQNISAAVDLNPCCNHGNDGMHEVLLGRNIGLPINASNLYNVTRDWPGLAGNYTVYYENHNATGILDDTRYADVAAYTALELELMHDQAGAVREVSKLTGMYNPTSVGMQDYVFTNGTAGEKGVYQTFKLALYILALTRTGLPVPPEIEARITNLWDPPTGGFPTGYDDTGKPEGGENAETAAIVMLAMRSIPGRLGTNYSIDWNVTGSTYLGASVRFDTENWTRDYYGSAYWDKTNIENVTLHQIPPGRFATMNFTRDIAFDPWTCHTLAITIGGTTISREGYCPLWLKYWYLFPITIGVVPVLVYWYYQRDKENQQDKEKSKREIS